MFGVEQNVPVSISENGKRCTLSWRSFSLIQPGALFVGADARYHDTQSKSGENFDNFTLGVKVGINF